MAMASVTSRGSLPHHVLSIARVSQTQSQLTIDEYMVVLKICYESPRSSSSDWSLSSVTIIARDLCVLSSFDQVQ